MRENKRVNDDKTGASARAACAFYCVLLLSGSAQVVAILQQVEKVGLIYPGATGSPLTRDSL